MPRTFRVEIKDDGQKILSNMVVDAEDGIEASYLAWEGFRSHMPSFYEGQRLWAYSTVWEDES